MKDPIIRARHLKAVQSAESREKLRISLSRPEVKEKVSGENSPSKRPDVRIKMSISRSGSKHWHWLGGTSRDKYCEKWTPELRRRIRSFFNYECILCGKSQEENGRNLDCHHVEYNKQACCDGQEVHFAALCHSCHAKMCSKRIDWKNILCRIIDEIYDGKSYYTKEEYLEYKQSGGE